MTKKKLTWKALPFDHYISWQVLSAACFMVSAKLYIEDINSFWTCFFYRDDDGNNYIITAKHVFTDEDESFVKSKRIYIRPFDSRMNILDKIKINPIEYIEMKDENADVLLIRQNDWVLNNKEELSNHISYWGVNPFFGRDCFLYWRPKLISDEWNNKIDLAEQSPIWLIKKWNLWWSRLFDVDWNRLRQSSWYISSYVNSWMSWWPCFIYDMPSQKYIIVWVIIEWMYEYETVRMPDWTEVDVKVHSGVWCLDAIEYITNKEHWEA